MTVLQLVTRMNVGGPARLLIELVRSLDGEIPMTLAAGEPPAYEGELVDAAVPVVRLPLVRPLRPSTDLRALLATSGLLRSIRPDIVHTHMAKAGAVGRVAARLVRPSPVTVHTFHGHVLAGYFGSSQQRAFLEVEKRLAGISTVLVAVSSGLRDQLLEMGIGRPDQFRVIPPGIDLAPFSTGGLPRVGVREALRIDRHAPLLGMVGRLAPIKANGTALAALRQLSDAHLVLVGDGECRALLQQEVNDHRLGDRVHFLGWRRDIPAILRELDVVLLTSSNEGMPIALIEALAAGRPVVASRVGGVPELVEHGQTGLLFNAGDVDDLAHCVERVVKDPAFGQQLGRAGRRVVEARYSIAAAVAAHAALYRELAGR